MRASRRSTARGPNGTQAGPGGLAIIRHPARRLAALLAVAAASSVVVISAAVASPRPAAPRATPEVSHESLSVAPAAAGRTAGPQPMASAQQVAPKQVPAQQVSPLPLTLTAADRRSCPAAATACVDLTRHITWLQSAGEVTFGPVRAEPGSPGSVHATPRGRFQVSWKAGPGFISNIYHDPMPWAVFFAAGGIAFHGGSLTVPSHGCVHLTTENAHYYNDHLPVGAEVVVF
ncbi:MAG TPA: L,D-transpeptidase family protein [Trebonia sp.]|jgi:lipoprotein-anchoring transpeptidase ErfK/SrfK